MLDNTRPGDPRSSNDGKPAGKLRAAAAAATALLLAVPAALGATTATAATTAADPGQVVSRAATLEYSLKGLKHNVAVQASYISGSYLYVTQRSGGDCYLSRLTMSGTTATYKDEMKLTRTGHCQTLDMYAHDGGYYLYVSSKSDPSTNYYWSLQVARVKYAAGKTVDYTDLRRFAYMNYANGSGSRLGDTYRVDAGGNNNYTVFRVQTKNPSSVTWSVYGTTALNNLLDGSEIVRMDSTGAKNAFVQGFTQTGTSIVRPNGSFQGADILGGSSIYTSGGAEGDQPKIAELSSGGAYRTLINITGTGNHEIEGVQNRNGRLYFVIVTDPVNKTDTQKIYSVID